MSDYISIFPVGSTNRISSAQTQLLGHVVRITDKNYAIAGTKPIFSGMSSLARIVLNGSGGTLAPGAICYWDIGTNGPGMEVDGIAAVGSNQLPAGVVDPFVSGTVADNETFLLWYYGPCKFLSTTGTAVAVGDALTLGASGRVDVYDVSAADATNTLYYCGRALAAVAAGTASGTLFRGVADMRF